MNEAIVTVAKKEAAAYKVDMPEKFLGDFLVAYRKKFLCKVPDYTPIGVDYTRVFFTIEKEKEKELLEFINEFSAKKNSSFIDIKTIWSIQDIKECIDLALNSEHEKVKEAFLSRLVSCLIYLTKNKKNTWENHSGSDPYNLEKIYVLDFEQIRIIFRFTPNATCLYVSNNEALRLKKLIKTSDFSDKKMFMEYWGYGETDELYWTICEALGDSCTVILAPH